ncbi:Arsenite methyltransferase [BD1-7 clade bacterium]|uniref:Arsenite methyltransferase n=1 Tax=BD1-7 clade bacterium TaxID=2029982 RepID=A0A5S9MP38_9GAMM|nr:Arsenite methyltransferase [BD1-7 clade bacterium]
MNAKTTAEKVQDYYGKVLQSSADLKTSACCPIDAMPAHLLPLMRNLHDDVKNKFYGCGSPIPLAIDGATVLDLGCGTGRDAYLLAQLVGESGNVIGVDMTDEQLDVARAHDDFHRKAFGYARSNTRFEKAYIEDLGFLDDNSVDVVVSNCVINLSADKAAVFEEIFRVLKPGGELYFSDIYASRRISQPLREDPVLLGECLSGALYTEDFRRMMADVGCQDFRIMSKGTVELHDPVIIEKIGMVDFYSITVRAFKLDLEDRCENFGQIATYRGGIKHAIHQFALDDHHLFEKGLPMPICSNTARMLEDTRLAAFFDILGNADTHYGLFDCGADDGVKTSSEAPCC